MDGSIRLSAKERKRLLSIYRGRTIPAVRLRAHVLLLLADGHRWSVIVSMLYTSSATISRWKKRFEADGLDAVFCEDRGRDAVWGMMYVSIVVEWVVKRTPRDFGFLRSRWSCGTLAILLRERLGADVCVETVRRWLREAGIVWRRPRPTLGPKDPAYAYKLGRIRRLLRELPANETAVFQDEVDVNLNPKIGSMWMPRGQQSCVETPGNNVKRYLAGSLDWRTGALIVSPAGTNRNAELFVAHLNDLRRRLRRYKVIHVICDNAKFHDCRLVRQFLNDWGSRIQIHFIPTYSPWTNPIERVWWHLHEEITRNHRCRTIDELITLTFQWFNLREFEIETSRYPVAA
jgi:transposase